MLPARMRNALRLTMASGLLMSSALALGADGMGGAPTATKPPSGPHEVSIGFNVFVPVLLTVPVGTTVTWVNNDGSNHNVVFADQIKSGRLRHDATYTRTFTVAGTYPYQCAIHGDLMKGTIMVQ
ncbi:MAG: cupredoxin domain-containing protein [Panacagrimonas sp.]